MTIHSTVPARVRRGKRAAPPPYDWRGEIDYDSLEFSPDVKEAPPDSMLQNDEIDQIIWLLKTYLALYYGEAYIFVNRETFICYDESNLNVRVAPDVYVAFDVNAEKIYRRRLYLPWEAKKPPDLVLEVASEHTARNDVERKPAIYALIGVPEYWLFDPTGGDLYGAPLIGLRLVDGEYQPIEMTREPDGILKGYSDVLGLSLCWDEGKPRLYDPALGEYLEDSEAALSARRAAEEQLDEERAVRIATEVVRDVEREARLAAEARRNAERDARLSAEEQLGEERNSRLTVETERDEECEARLTAEEQRDAERDARLSVEERLGEERDARLSVEERLDAERDARLTAEEQLGEEREARLAIEAEIARLRQELRSRQPED